MTNGQEDEIVARAKEYELPDEGQHAVVCCDVYDLGMVQTTWQGKTSEKHKIRIYFLTPQIAKRGELKGQNLLVSKQFTLSMHANAELRAFLGSWRGKPYTDAEAKQGVKLHAMLGIPALVQVIHNERGYADINSIMRLPKGMEPPTVPATFERRKDREARERAAGDRPSQGPLPGEPDYDNDDDLPF